MVEEFETANGKSEEGSQTVQNGEPSNRETDGISRRGIFRAGCVALTAPAGLSAYAQEGTQTRTAQRDTSASDPGQENHVLSVHA